MPLHKDAMLLATFITPGGRYNLERLSFRIASATEQFQKRISQLVEAIDGVNTRLCRVLSKFRERQMTSATMPPARVRESVWRPGISSQIKQMVERCEICACEAQETNLPSTPWQKVGVELFQWKNGIYRILVDYVSQSTEQCNLTTDYREV